MINKIPEYVTIEESYLLLIESAEQDFNAMWSNIAINEYNDIIGKSFVSESGFGDKVKSIVKSITDWIKARWNDLTKLFEKALNAIRDKIDEFNSKITKSTLKWIPKKLNKLKDKAYGKTYEYPNFDSISSDGGSVFAAVRAYSDKVLSTLTGSGSNEDVKKDLESIDTSFKREFGAGKDSKDGAIKGAMQKMIQGNEVTIDRNYITSHYQSMVDGCADFSKVQRSLRGVLKSAKKEFDKQISELKKKEKENNDFTSRLGVIAPYIKKTHHYFSTATSTILAATKNKMAKERAIIMRLAITFGKDQTTNESHVDYGESQTYQSEMASLFNFNI